LGDDCSSFTLLDPETDDSKNLESARNYNSVTSAVLAVLSSYYGCVLGIGFN